MLQGLKGISPIVASVLLIAFSTAIAAIVGTWAMGYTQSELVSLETCSKLDLTYYNYNYDAGTVTMQNIGTSVKAYNLYIFLDTNQKAFIKKIEGPFEANTPTEITFDKDMIENNYEDVKGLVVEVVGCKGKTQFVPIIK
ncbi:MAG: hypothetical protein DRP06_00850 [Candidatus Aenigmatarchaeota archaeon]|nr:MAG: hypothetical protein DRP06_00850 [Candidatus Aenigmarchaeota archaeon]